MRGRVAQLGECYIRIVEVEGSNPFVSTKKSRFLSALFFLPTDAKTSETYVYQGFQGFA